MKRLILIWAFLWTSLNLTGCEVVGDIFKAGMWIGVIGVVFVVGILIWLFRRISR